MNPRKDKKLLAMWLSDAEMLSLKETLKDYNPVTAENIIDIFIEAHERRDIIWGT